MNYRSLLREMLRKLHLDLTKNMKYDRLTKRIMEREIHSSSCCIDVGCHKGEILDIMLELAPEGLHYAFEPIPSLYEGLLSKYSNSVKLLPFALSDNSGRTKFHYVSNAPAYSGIERREYNVANPDIELIEVDMVTLDSVISSSHWVHFIKIDVEGGEFAVLKGARNLLMRCKPCVIFECGLGASNYYGTDPADLFGFLSDVGMNIFTLKQFLRNSSPLSLHDFLQLYNTNKEYYFVAK